MANGFTSGRRGLVVTRSGRCLLPAERQFRSPETAETILKNRRTANSYITKKDGRRYAAYGEYRRRGEQRREFLTLCIPLVNWPWEKKAFTSSPPPPNET